MLATTYIAPSSYQTSPYDSMRKDTHFPISQHPLMCEMLIPRATIEEMNKDGMQFPDPDTMAKLAYSELEEAAAKKDVGHYVFRHARPFRFLALLDTKSWQVPREEWLREAGHVWVDCEGPGTSSKLWWEEVFKLPDSLMTMDEESRALYDALGESTTIYRGANSKIHAANGLSWTLNREKAVWFAHRFRMRKMKAWVATATISKKDVAAVFLNRGEHEIIPAHPLTKIAKCEMITG